MPAVWSSSSLVFKLFPKEASLPGGEREGDEEGVERGEINKHRGLPMQINNNNNNNSNFNTMQQLHKMIITRSKAKVNAFTVSGSHVTAFESGLPVETLGGQNTFNNDDTWEQIRTLSSFIS